MYSLWTRVNVRKDSNSQVESAVRWMNAVLSSLRARAELETAHFPFKDLYKAKYMLYTFKIVQLLE